MKPVCQSLGEDNYFRVKRITSIMELINSDPTDVLNDSETI